MKKDDQTIYEWAEVCERVVYKTRDLLKKVPVDVIGHVDSRGLCCRNGTVALVKHGFTQNLFRLGRHLMQAVHHRILRRQSFQIWQDVVCVLKRCAGIRYIMSAVS